MKISIALATFNGGRYLREQLESFLMQTRHPDELIVCDDGSTDDTIVILNNFKQNAPFSVNIYENKKNLGHLLNFEKSIGLCNGDIIFLSDQDDVWFSDKIEQHEKVHRNSSDIWVVVNDQEITDSDLNSLHQTTLSRLKELGIDKDWLLAGCTMSFKASLKPILMPLPLDVFAGHDIWIGQFSQLCGAKKIIPVALQYYRRHDFNTSHSIVCDSMDNKYKSIFFNKKYWADPIPSYRQKMAEIRITQKRLELVKISIENNSLNSCVDIDKLQRTLSAKHTAFERRISTLSVKGYQRLKNCLFMLAEGDYAYMDGMKSFIKDLLRTNESKV